MEKEKNIIFIHGACSTPITFNYLAQRLPIHNRLDFSYNSSDDIDDIVLQLAQFIPEGDWDIIAHSMGGVLSMGASYGLGAPKIRKIVTISSPFAGSKMASYLKWLYPGYGLFNNVSQSNPLILKIQKIGAVVPTLNIVTSSGDWPLIREKNDGVVSVESQMSLKNCERKLFELNHFEVLLSPQVANEIISYLW